MAECECMAELDENGECPACKAAWARICRQNGPWHPNLKPLEPGEHTPGIRRLQDCD